jgi:hypothetical protein
MASSELINATKPKVMLELPVIKRVFEIQLFKCYKALRPKGKYCLIQVPNEFINSHYFAGHKYGLTMGLDEQKHRIILIDLDDKRKMLNNRRCEK